MTHKNSNFFACTLHFCLVSLLLIATDLASQSIKINEIMASNGTTLADEDGDFPDWIELYNSGASPVKLDGFGLSDDEQPFKWVFPNIELKSHSFLLIFASGKDRREWYHWETIITQGDNWKYRVGNSAPPAAWRQIDFDDSGWLSGPSGFGYGDGDDATLVPAAMSLCIRKEFTIQASADAGPAILHIDYDDAFVAWLNGAEIARDNIGQPGDKPPFNQPADTYREAELYQGGLPEKYLLEENAALLQTGKNVLAIQVQNFAISSSDLSIIPFFTIGFRTAPAGTLRGVPEIIQLAFPNLHANFKIKSSGETLSLHHPDGSLLDQVESGNLPADLSKGRQPDGGADWYFFPQPTPCAPNTSTGYQRILTMPEFSMPGGFYSEIINLSLTTTEPGGKIYFTLNGSEPTTASSRFTSPFQLNQTTVVRARVLVPGALTGKVASQTYFFNETPNLPYISISTNPPNLWDPDSGIYVLGRNASPDFPHFGANFWENREIPAHFEFFETDGTPGFMLDAGMKIFGGWSRGFSQKSLSVFARSRYGASEISYQLFPEKPIEHFEAIILRNSGNDWTSTLFRDAMMQSLVRDLNLESMAYRPVVVFLNGKYWGIQNIREKLNEHFLAANCGVDPDNVDLLESEMIVIEGDAEHYQALLEYISSHNMQAAASYAAVSHKMDVDNFITYQIAQIYFDNTDWPGNNVKYWRPKVPDGKWRWLIYDTDFGFGLFNLYNYTRNTLAFATRDDGPDWPNPPWSTFLLRKLLENSEFKAAFVVRFTDLLNHCFLPDRIYHRIDEMKSVIQLEIVRHRARWPESIPNWENDTRILKQFASFRLSYVIGHLRSEFGLSLPVDLTLNVSEPEQGRLKLNSLWIDEFPWKGRYFPDFPVRLSAVPKPGFRFCCWDDSTLGDSATIQVNLAQDRTIAAHFEKEPSPNNPVVINEINYNSADHFNTGDWVEFLNPAEQAVDLANWQFKDENDSHVFTFPAPTILAPNAFLVLCRNKSAFSTFFPDVQNVIGNMSFGFSGAGELLRLYNEQGALVDSVVYADSAPWPNAPDGNGFTLELRDALSDNADYRNWAASQATGGTPGTPNSNATGVKKSPPVIRNFSLYQNFPNPFNHATTIAFDLTEAGDVTFSLFNVQGQKIVSKFLADRLPGHHQIKWSMNTARIKGLHISSGVYFYQIEISAADKKWTGMRKMLYLK